jgi:hypothetical protein
MTPLNGQIYGRFFWLGGRDRLSGFDDSRSSHLHKSRSLAIVWVVVDRDAFQRSDPSKRPNPPILRVSLTRSTSEALVRHGDCSQSGNSGSSGDSDAISLINMLASTHPGRYNLGFMCNRLKFPFKSANARLSFNCVHLEIPRLPLH